MIRVLQQPEPTDFNTKVREKGLRALERCNEYPISKNFWKNRDYWKLCHDDLMLAYNKTCAYLAIKLFRYKKANPTYHSSVEHFIPKSHDPQLAYEWNNLLVASQQANSNRDQSDILDPRTIPENLFALHLNSGIIYVNNTFDNQTQNNANQTIENIGLKCEKFCRLRALLYKRYKDNPQKLQEMSPFIYNEAVRQGKIVVE